METFTRVLVAEQRVYGWLRDVHIDAEWTGSREKKDQKRLLTEQARDDDR